MTDGRSWVEPAKGIIRDERQLPPRTRELLKNALLADMLEDGIDPALIDDGTPALGKISITFPETDRPTLRIHLDLPDNFASQQTHARFGNYIAGRMEHWPLGQKPPAFMELRKQGAVRVSHTGGYNARSDTTISANDTDSLVQAISSIVGNMLIRRKLEKTISGHGIA